jgi:uncharacterized protein
MQLWPPPGLFPGLASIRSNVEEANRVYATGSFGEVLAFRLREIALIVPLHIYVFPRTLGLFLLGALVWRSGVLQKPDRALVLATAAGCIGLGAAMILLRAGNAIADANVGALATPAGTILLALGYGAIIIAVANSANGKVLLGWAAPLGRMAFTNYIAQSLIFGWIFYGYGLGLFGRLGAAEALAIGLVVYVAQVIFSGWWLGRYRYGPVEWLWRTLMYGTPQPILRAGLDDSRQRMA